MNQQLSHAQKLFETDPVTLYKFKYQRKITIFKKILVNV